MNINEINVRIFNYNNECNNLYKEFMDNCYNLVDISKGNYQVKENVKLNKIHLKDYIFNSNLYKSMDRNNVTIGDLKEYIDEYDKFNNTNSEDIKLALKLYEILDKMEDTINNKIEFEIDSISKYVPHIVDIKTCEVYDYDDLYNKLIVGQDDDIKNIINDIFNYYSNNKDINIDNT